MSRRRSTSSVMGPPPDRDVVMGPPPVPAPLSSAHSAPPPQQRGRESQEIQDKYKKLKRKFFELEEKHKETSTELQRSSERNVRMREERDHLLDRILELEGQTRTNGASSASASQSVPMAQPSSSAFPRTLLNARARTSFIANLRQAIAEDDADDDVDPILTSRHVGPQARRRDEEERRERERQEEEAREAQSRKGGRKTRTSHATGSHKGKESSSSTSAQPLMTYNPAPHVGSSVHDGSPHGSPPPVLVSSTGTRLRIKPPANPGSPPPDRVSPPLHHHAASSSSSSSSRGHSQQQSPLPSTQSHPHLYTHPPPPPPPHFHQAPHQSPPLQHQHTHHKRQRSLTPEHDDYHRGPASPGGGMEVDMDDERSHTGYEYAPPTHEHSQHAPTRRGSSHYEEHSRDFRNADHDEVSELDGRRSPTFPLRSESGIPAPAPAARQQGDVEPTSHRRETRSRRSSRVVADQQPAYDHPEEGHAVEPPRVPSPVPAPSSKRSASRSQAGTRKTRSESAAIAAAAAAAAEAEAAAEAAAAEAEAAAEAAAAAVREREAEAEAEAAARRTEEEAVRKAEEEATWRAEEEARRVEEEEAARRAEEAVRRTEEQEAAKRAEEVRRAEAEAARLAEEEVAMRAEEEAVRIAEKEAARRAEEAVQAAATAKAEAETAAAQAAAAAETEAEAAAVAAVLAEREASQASISPAPQASPPPDSMRSSTPTRDVTPIVRSHSPPEHFPIEVDIHYPEPQPTSTEFEKSPSPSPVSAHVPSPIPEPEPIRDPSPVPVATPTAPAQGRSSSPSPPSMRHMEDIEMAEAEQPASGDTGVFHPAEKTPTPAPSSPAAAALPAAAVSIEAPGDIADVPYAPAPSPPSPVDAAGSPPSVPAHGEQQAVKESSPLMDSIVRVAEAAVAAQKAASTPPPSVPSASTSVNSLPPSNSVIDPNLDPSLFTESEKQLRAQDGTAIQVASASNNVATPSTSASPPAAANNGSTNGAASNGAPSNERTTSTPNLSANPYLSLSTAMMPKMHTAGSPTPTSAHPMSMNPYSMYYPNPGTPITPTTPAYPHPYANPYYYLAAPMAGPSGMYPASPGFVPPSAQRPPSEVQRHAKPKRLKAHTVTSKSYSIPMVPRDKKGKPMLPLNVGIMTVINLGDVCMREHFHTERYIFPVGYEVTRRYLSTIDPNIEVVYHCTILDGGDGPKFQIVPSDVPDRPVIAGTATGAWSSIVKQANAIRNRQHSNSVSGPDFFGLGQNTIKHLIQELPNADRLRDYVWQNFVEGGPLGGRHAAVIPALPEEYDASHPIGAYYPSAGDKLKREANVSPASPRGMSHYPQHIVAQAEAQRAQQQAVQQAKAQGQQPSPSSPQSAHLPQPGQDGQQQQVQQGVTQIVLPPPTSGEALNFQEYQPPQMHGMPSQGAYANMPPGPPRNAQDPVHSNSLGQSPSPQSPYLANASAPAAVALPPAVPPTFRSIMNAYPVPGAPAPLNTHNGAPPM